MFGPAISGDQFRTNKMNFLCENYQNGENISHRLDNNFSSAQNIGLSFSFSRNDWILFNSITILLPSNFLHAQKQEEEKTFTQMQNTIHKCVNRDTACVCTRTPDNRRFFLDTVNGGGGSSRICAKVCAKTAK